MKKRVGVYAIEFPRLRAVYVGSSRNMDVRLRSHRFGFSALGGKRGSYMDHHQFGIYYEKVMCGEEVEYKIVEKEVDPVMLSSRRAYYSLEYDKDGWTLINFIAIQFVESQSDIDLTPAQAKVIDRVSRMFESGGVDSVKFEEFLDRIEEGSL